MRLYRFAVTGLMLLLVATSSLALYYRNRAVSSEAASSALRDKLDKALPPVHRAAPDSRIHAGEPVQPEPQASKTSAEPVTAGVGSISPEHRPTAGEPRVPALERPSARSSDLERPRNSGLEWMENLRTNSLARYREIQQRRQEQQERANVAWDQAVGYFSNRETANMDDSETQEYNRMLTLLEQTRGFTQQLQADLARDQRRQLMSSVRSNMNELAPLLDRERGREFYDLALASGYSPSEASLFADYASQIVSNTSVRNIFPGIRGGFGYRPPDRFRTLPSPPAK